MKGIIYRDGKFISVLSDTDSETLYGKTTKNKKADTEASANKKKKVGKLKKMRIKQDED